MSKIVLFIRKFINKFKKKETSWVTLGEGKIYVDGVLLGKTKGGTTNIKWRKVN
jgi:hypothetical protein